MAQSNFIDLGSPTANMFGIEPCPKCSDRYRVPNRRDGVLQIDCHECGFRETANEACQEMGIENG